MIHRTAVGCIAIVVVLAACNSGATSKASSPDLTARLLATSAFPSGYVRTEGPMREHVTGSPACAPYQPPIAAAIAHWEPLKGKSLFAFPSREAFTETVQYFASAAQAHAWVVAYPRALSCTVTTLRIPGSQSQFGRVSQAQFGPKLGDERLAYRQVENGRAGLAGRWTYVLTRKGRYTVLLAAFETGVHSRSNVPVDALTTSLAEKAAAKVP